MLCYFLSKQSCALKINGEFSGYAGNNLCKTEITENKNDGNKTLIEFIPPSNGFEPVNFVLDRARSYKRGLVSLSENSGANVRLIDLYGDLLIIPKFFRRKTQDKTDVFTKTLADGINATVFCFDETIVFLEANNKSNFFSLGDVFLKVEFTLLNNGYLLAVAKNANKTRYFLFALSSAPELVLVRDGDEFFIDNNVFTVIKKNIGVCKIERRENFDLDNPENSYVSFLRNVPVFKLNENLIPYAFLEEVFLRSNFEDYLSRDLKENKNYIPEFIGDFEFFLPPIKRGGGIAMIKKNKQKADFLSLTIKNGCVTDINYL